MKIRAVFFGNPDDYIEFDSSDQYHMERMCKDLKNFFRCGIWDSIVEYQTEDGRLILKWPLDEDVEGEEDEMEYSRVGIDFSPSAPWNAPGMSVSDFI